MRRFLGHGAFNHRRKSECRRLRRARLPVISHNETADRRIALGPMIAST